MPSDKRIFIVPTRFGFLFAFIILSLLIGGTVFENTFLFVTSGILVTFGLVCMHQTHFNLAAVKIETIEPTSGFSGEKVSWRIRLSNNSFNTSYSINVRHAIIDVPPRESTVENMGLRLRARGKVVLNEVKISSTYPLGLFYAWKFWEGELVYHVYPRRLESVELHKYLSQINSPFSAQEDFKGHRPFTPGDSSRRVDWKAFARTRQMYVKLFDNQLSETIRLDFKSIAGDQELKLSYLASALSECQKRQRPFVLILPNEKGGGEQSCSDLKLSLERLAIFGQTDESA